MHKASPTIATLSNEKQSRQSTSVEKNIAPRFVKAVLSDNQLTNNATTRHDVLLTKPNGASLQITQLSHIDILKLTKQFCE